MNHDRTKDLDASSTDDLWYNDGTLILEAKDERFCVYGGLLADISSFFSNLLSIPPPKEGNVRFDGCPVVTLDDSPNDLVSFLKAIFHPCFFEAPPSTTDLLVVGSVLRLSCKYDAPYFKSRALSHLNCTFPITLDGWNRRDKTRTIPPLELTPFKALRIAKEFDLDWLLPSILYCICSHPIERSFDSSLIPNEEDKRICIDGRQKLLIIQAKAALHMSTNRAFLCCRREKCTSRIYYLADILSGLETAGLLNFFEDVTADNADNFCPSCRVAFAKACAAAAQKLWQELPAIFGLKGWEDLEKKRLDH